MLYQRQLALYLLPVFGRMRLVDITPTMAREWWREFNPQIPTARAHSYSLLKSVLAAAMLEDPPLIDANPCRIRGAGATRRARRIRPATVEELAVIVEAMPERLRAAVLIAAWGGLRWGEIAALRRCDIEGDVINVKRAVVRLPGRDPDDDGPRRARFEIGTPKSEAGIRAVTMPASVTPTIHAHLDAMADRRPQALLFPNTLGGFSWPPHHWTATGSQPGRPRGVQICGFTICATPRRYSPPPAERPSPNSWPDSGTPRSEQRSATNTRRRGGTPRSQPSFRHLLLRHADHDLARTRAEWMIRRSQPVCRARAEPCTDDPVGMPTAPPEVSRVPNAHDVADDRTVRHHPPGENHRTGLPATADQPDAA